MGCCVRGDGEGLPGRDEILPLAPVTSSVLDRVLQRGFVRVGYFEDSLPYAFFNDRGELVGFDVEMALQLAHDLGVGPELVPISRAALDVALDASACDLVMSGAVVTADRAVHLLLDLISTKRSRSSFRPSRQSVLGLDDHMRDGPAAGCARGVLHAEDPTS